MAANEDYVPKGDLEFFNWQKNLFDVTGVNLVAWGIAMADHDEWKVQKDIYEPLYDKITNKNTRSKADVEAHRAGRKVYEKYVRDWAGERLLYNSAISVQQRSTLQITIKDTVKTARPAIESAPFVDVEARKGARIVIECRVNGDSSRASIHPDADEVEVRYTVATTVPASPADCNLTETSTKAKFTLEHDIADAGKKFNGFFRWKNTTDKSKSGPWSLLVSTTITN